MPRIDKEKYLCVGCGACAYSCPRQCISYQIDIMGRYKPIVDYKKCIECKLCERLCPVYHHDTIKKTQLFNPIVGNYISIYKGFDERFRKTSASGGFLTAVLSQLLTSKSVDCIVCVTNTPKDGMFYQYDFVQDPNKLIQNSKSVYYPLEISDVLKRIKNEESRYAIVTLPCQAKAIRNVMRRDPILNMRIKFLLGLVCGGVPGKSMVEYIANDNDAHIDDIQYISFRDKSDNIFNRQYVATLRFADRSSIISRSPDEAFGFSFLNKLFHYRGCNLCDDIFAEYADAAFMDAWLPEHNEDKYGTSICIVRNEELHLILLPLWESNMNCKEVDIQVPIAAQNNVGLILRKKKQSYFKRKIYRRFGYITPDAVEQSLSFVEKVKFLIRTLQELSIQNISYSQWKRYKMGKITFKKYQNAIKKTVKIVKSF